MDINNLLRRSGLSANEEEIAILAKDLEKILAIIETIPDSNKHEQYLNYMALRPDISLTHDMAEQKSNNLSENDFATKENILSNAKCLQDDMFKI